jgi:hypothetical protein
MTQGLSAVAYLVVAFALCWVGKLAYGLFHPGTRVDRELTARDNVAFAVPLGAYYLGILIVMGAPLSGQARPGLGQDLLATAGWGLLAVTLLTWPRWPAGASSSVDSTWPRRCSNAGTWRSG